MSSRDLVSVIGYPSSSCRTGRQFRKYMADLGSFLAPEYGICIEENIIAHILWADDLVLLSDSEKGMQNQLDGLLKFCSLNLMSVNEIKTKSMVIGNKSEARVNLTFNKKDIEQVNQYKRLGVIVCSISRNNEDIFACNYPYLCDQGRKALFGVLHRLRSITPIPPRVQFKLFDAVIKPILIYGSDVWGHNKSGTSMIDKVMLRFSRCVLNVKATTSNVMVYGECGILPPSVHCTVSTMCYMNRLHHMPNNSIVKQVYNELFKLHQMGFVTWVTKVGELVETYSINIDDSPAKFKSECKQSVFGEFTRKWTEDVQNIQRNPILRTYCKIKQDFGMEMYLELIKNHKYRTAMTQLRTSSHTLAIEYGRYTRTKTKLEDRYCLFCPHILEDEKHFLVECIVNKTERDILFSKVEHLFQTFRYLDKEEKFIFVLNSKDQQVLTWVGKFIYNSFKTRNEKLV